MAAGGVARGWDPEFESALLQRRVSGELRSRLHSGDRHPCRPAGLSRALHFPESALDSFTATPAPESGDKLTRFGPFSSQCRAGNVKIRRGAWNEELFRVLEDFPDLP